jgi:hypothetical protein
MIIRDCVAVVYLIDMLACSASVISDDSAPMV